MRDVADKLDILVIATEWASGHGGLSTFNRHLCRALAKLGHRVTCVVSEAREPERKDARASGVELLVATRERWGLDDPLGAAAVPGGREPDVIIGHGRVTGPAARNQAKRYPWAVLCHFIHVAPGMIEWFKDRFEAEWEAQHAPEERERLECALARAADVSFAVGPVLAERYATLLHPHRTEVYEFVPGVLSGSFETGQWRPPAGVRVLLMGRGEDFALKGVQLAARSMGIVREEFGSSPVLVVRGATKGTARDLRKRIVALSGNPRLEVEVLEYVDDATAIAEDVRRSSLVVMPSRHEGFGLVALEALSAGVPVLVSATSGFGRHLLRAAPLQAQKCVLDVSDDVEADARTWSVRILSILKDRPAAFEEATAARDALHRWGTWESATQDFQRVVYARLREKREGKASGSVEMNAGRNGISEQVDSFFRGSNVARRIVRGLFEDVRAAVLELAFNAGEHGGATMLRIGVDSTTVCIEDNGAAFNPFGEHARPRKPRGMGLEFLRRFIQKYADVITVRYERTGLENRVTLSFSSDLGSGELVRDCVIELHERSGASARGFAQKYTVVLPAGCSVFHLSVDRGTFMNISDLREGVMHLLATLPASARLVLHFPRGDLYRDIVLDYVVDERVQVD